MEESQLSERERAKIQGRFGVVLLLLMIAVFFSISAPDSPWSRLAIALGSAVSLIVAMFASGARQKSVS